MCLNNTIINVLSSVPTTMYDDQVCEIEIISANARDTVSVSTSQSRDGLEACQRLVSVSSRGRLGLGQNGQRLGLEGPTSRSCLDLGN